MISYLETIDSHVSPVESELKLVKTINYSQLVSDHGFAPVDSIETVYLDRSKN